jgi:hypothetical protein
MAMKKWDSYNSQLHLMETKVFFSMQIFGIIKQMILLKMLDVITLDDFDTLSKWLWIHFWIVSQLIFLVEYFLTTQNKPGAKIVSRYSFLNHSQAVNLLSFFVWLQIKLFLTMVQSQVRDTSSRFTHQPVALSSDTTSPS